MNNRSRTKTISSIQVVENSNPVRRKISVALGFIIILGGFSYFTYVLGGTISGSAPAKEQLSLLKEQVEKLDSEREKLASTANSADSVLNIERATQKQLVSQVQTLTAENSRLKEDLAFFENLMPASTGPEGVRIGAFKADASNKTQLRYRILVMQGGKNVADYMGELQFQLTVNEEGKNVVLTLPDTKNNEAARLKLSFKYYQRLEGALNIPEGAVVKSVQARILDRGQVRTFQTVNF